MLTLKTAKKLKEVGWSKSVSYIYAISGSGKSQIFRATPFINAKIKETEYYYPCPSLEELLAEMPIIAEGVLRCSTYLTKNKKGYIVEYCVDFEDTEKDFIEIATGFYPDPTEAVAQLYIKLKQEGLC